MPAPVTVPFPGVHVYSHLPHLSDVTAAGVPWRTWQRLELLYRRPPQWLRFLGRWGNPANCWKPFGWLCSLSDGPTGIPLKEPDFQCPEGESIAAARGRGYTSFWTYLFGR